MAQELDPRRDLRKGRWVKHDEITALDGGKKTIYPKGAGIYQNFDEKVGLHCVDLVNWDTGVTYGVAWLQADQFSLINNYVDIPPTRRPK